MSNVLAIAGLGRCGSSLVMQMLAAGGAPVLGEYPAYEKTEGMTWPGWLQRVAAAPGPVALKWLDPHKMPLSSGMVVSVVWLERNFQQQAKSQLKFSAAGKFRFGRAAHDKMEQRLIAEQQTCLALLRARGYPVLRVGFESIIREPESAARVLARVGQGVLGVRLDVDRMAAQVLPRGSACLRDLSVEQELVAKRAYVMERVLGGSVHA